MAQTITKQDVIFNEVRIIREFNPETGEIETFGIVGYLVETDDPAYSYRKKFRAGPLTGANLATADDIFTKMLAAIKNFESIP